MPVYNCEAYVSEAIESILGQKYKDFEFIILDDCSGDNSVKIIESYRDNRIVLHPNEEKSYLSKTRNLGMLLAKGEFMAFMDSDDIALPNRFEKQIEYMEHHKECSVVGSFVKSFTSSDKTSNRTIWNFPVSDEEIKVRFLYANSILNPTAFLRTSVIRDCKILNDENLETCEDYDFWVNLIPYADYHNISEPLLLYRINPQGMTQNSKSNYASLLRRQEIIKKIHGKALENFGFLLTKSQLNLYNSVIGEGDWPRPDMDTFMSFKELINFLIEQYNGKLISPSAFKSGMEKMILNISRRLGFIQNEG